MFGPELGFEIIDVKLLVTSSIREGEMVLGFSSCLKKNDLI